ncbi:NADH-dependent flavin reductase subunit 1-like [Littorina saxatilis]|uniref:NADPH-dependent FMN reductase-like domain-containing protein n=1 Tax=Littorina saxatilis TaxID=31220 RepID=A0AAN9AQR7_9CAEN
MYRNYREQKMASSKLKIVMFLGTVREGRLGPRVTKFIQAQLQSKYDITLFDPQEIDLPLMKKPLHFYKDRSQAPEMLVNCEKKLKEADAFILVTAEYNHSVPPALSNLLDHFGSSLYSYKPSGIVCYSPGPYGGMRAAMQLRCLLSELGTLSVSNIFGIPEIMKAIDEDGKPLNDRMVSGLNRMMTQLDWHAHSMKNHRDQFGLPQ